MKTSDQKLKLWLGIGIGVTAVGVAVVTYALSRHAPSYSTETVTRRNITQIVRASGTVVAEQESTLSFSTQGKIQEVLVHAGDVVHKGDILARLDNGTIQAQLSGAMADLTASESQLSKLESGARPEELALYDQKYTDTSSSLIVAMNNAYLQATDAIINKTDALFTNGNSVNPVITVRTDSQIQATNINMERIKLRDQFNALKDTLARAQTSTSTIALARQSTRDVLLATQQFLSDLSAITNALSVGNSGLSQATINTYLSTVSASQLEVTGALNSFTTADAAWSNAGGSLTLENAGTRNEDVASQSALTAKASAQVDAYRSALSQTYIRAPFDGTITDVNMKVGEVVVPGISADENIGIINTALFNVEAYVPQNTIGSMNVGNPATVSFDAYGSSTLFPAHIYLVSPAETIKNGISSYKVTLRFDQADERIRSGLNANVLITTATSTDALAVPTRAIITQGDKKYVLVQDSTKKTFTQRDVTVGISGSDGYTEIINGVAEGDVVAHFGTDSY
ncbi:MAG TPA: efflux RND transporter periplasmic adaptor subunit [Candidatus Paceibacterota bacterium]|jgi:HlyD family secretion protein|nr:efflux RND transporter periplasmic adaptor subunit [Candidatus Paceibacterota bacterium]